MRIQNTQDKQSFSAGRVFVTRKFIRKDPFLAAKMQNIEDSAQEIAQKYGVDFIFNYSKLDNMSRVTISDNKTLPGDNMWARFRNWIHNTKKSYEILDAPGCTIPETDEWMLLQLEHKTKLMKHNTSDNKNTRPTLDEDTFNKSIMKHSIWF